MILPTKHIPTHRSLLGVGAEVLYILERPMTVSKLWDEIRNRKASVASAAPIDYRWFVLSLDFLYMIEAVTLRRGLIEKASR
jgi:hypothetical protein